MILKLRETNQSIDSDRFTAAGNKSEDQMAFYLKRAFEFDPNIYVFNDLRLTNDQGDVAQIDHLVLFAKGMVIIESKSVTSKVKINKLGEWSRLWDNRWAGFQSPIQQAKRQVEFLQNLLRANKAELRGKILFGALQHGFGMFPMDILIAISDTGTIERDGQYPEVVKADQITDQIRAFIKKRDVSFLSWALKSKAEEKWDSMNEGELKKLTLFLLARHTARPHAVPEQSAAVTIESPAQIRAPVESPKPAVNNESPTEDTAQQRCQHCQSAHLQILYGHNYYFKCLDCSKNTKINLACSKCGGQARLRKEKATFFKECACGEAQLFFVNG